MLVTVQFPIADARPFGPQYNLRLPLPDWPEPETSICPQFVHFFGEATERIREPDEAWPDEIKFVQAARGIRFEKLERHQIAYKTRKFHPRCAFRRLFCDGGAVVRAEIGIAHKKLADQSNNITIEEILYIVRGIAELPTIVPNLTGDTNVRPILTQGKHLARLYAYASMTRDIFNNSLGFQLVEAGDPLILVELSPEQMDFNTTLRSYDGLTKLNSTSINGADALFCRLNTVAGIVSTWVIQKGTATIGQLRSLRLCLNRLHAEREVLDLILKQIHRGRLLNPISEDAVNLLDQYFNERIKIVSRDKWGGMKQSEIVAAFDATNSVVRKATQEQLVKRYEGGRLQVWKKIEAYQEHRRSLRSVNVVNLNKGAIMVDKHVNVSGTGNIVNVAEYMSNVTNTVNNNLAESGLNKEVKDLIKELTEEIQKVASNADAVQVKKMGKNLEALSNEVASEEPDRQWYEVSLQGIMDAAKAIGTIADPVISIAKKISALLLF